MKMYNAMSMMHHTPEKAQSSSAPIQLVLGQQQAPQDMMFKKMMMKMMMKKMFKQEMDDDNDSPFGSMGATKYSGMGGDDSQYKFFEKMMKSMNRNKRATDDLFELGDRLTEKLKEETVEMQAKLGNASCVLKELDIIDQNEN